MSLAHIEDAIPQVTKKHLQEVARPEEKKIPRLLLLDTKASTVFNFRGALVEALAQKGYTITVATPDVNRDIAEKLSKLGVQLCHIPFKRAGMNPFEDIRSLYRIYSFIRKLQPDVFLGVSLKPCTLGVIAARLAGVPHRFALLPGLGYAFTEGREIKRRIARWMVRFICRISLRLTQTTIFQNDDDKQLFIGSGLLREAQAAKVNGSGVDLKRFMPAPFPPSPFTFLMISRLLEDKGVREYVAAAKIIKRQYPQTRFLLIGATDDQNPAAIPKAELQSWTSEGAVEYGGTVADVRPVIADCHVFVLPSYYREGVPKAILEAMAMGRPVITTRTPGCRETVPDDLNGILVAPRDVGALVSAELQILSSPHALTVYGSESRALAERKFDVNIVVGQFLNILDGKGGPDSLQPVEDARESWWRPSLPLSAR